MASFGFHEISRLVLTRAAIGLLVVGLCLGCARLARAQDEPVEGIEFVGLGTPGLDTIFLRGIGSDDAGGLLLVEVWANEVSDLFGVSFALQFPEQQFKFPKGRSTVFVEGPFLSESGAVETVLAVRQNGREIVVGHTRIRDAPGVSGSGLLMTLEFRGLGVAGSKKFRFRRPTAFDSSGAEVEDYRWLSGKAIVTVAEPPG